MKILHFKSTYGSHWEFRRVPEQLQWHIFTGTHSWVIQFSCKCNACKVQRATKRYGLTLEELESSRFCTPAMKQAITQLRFREAQKQV